jgi:hypothetical protein
MYGFFTHGTVPPSRLYSSGFLSLPDHLRRLPSPTHFRCGLPGHVAFTTLQVLFSRGPDEGETPRSHLVQNRT